MEITKITRLTDTLYKKILRDKELNADFKKLFGIPETEKVCEGVSVVRLNKDAKTRDVFKCSRGKKEIFYVVISPITPKLAYCYSVFPCD